MRLALVGSLLAVVSCVSAPGPTARPEPSPPVEVASQRATATSGATPGADDVSRFVRVLVSSWRPAGPTVVIDRRPGVGQGHVVVAVPLSGAPPVELVSFASDGPTWDIRSDGSAIVAAVNSYCASGACDANPKRLALVDLRAGRASWLTAADQTLTQGPPLWSPDGAFVYYGTARGDVGTQRSDLGIFRVRADGTAPIRITDPVPPAAASFGLSFSSASPQRVTPDGFLLWYAIAGERGTLRVRDLSSGSDRTFLTDEPCVAIVAWRAAAPGAVVRYGGCQTPSSRLALWDVRTGAQTVIVDRPLIASDADWDPTGARVVAAVTDVSSNSRQLTVVSGRDRTPIPDAPDALFVRWLSAGIAYTTIANTATTSAPDCVFGFSEVRFLAAATGPPKTLYRACAIGGYLLTVDP